MTQDHTIYLKDYKPYPYDIETIDLNFILDETVTYVTSTLVISPKKITKKNEPLFLNGEHLTLKTITLDGETIDESLYTLDEKGLTLKSPPYQTFTLKIKTELNPSANTSLMGLYVSNNIFCTQCEAEGFRKITYYPDRPDVLSVFTVYITAEKALYPFLLSNGNPLASEKKEDEKTLDKKMHKVSWHDPHPKPSYLFALIAGDLDLLEGRYTTRSGKAVTLGIYVEKGKKEQAHYAMSALERSMRWDEERFNLEYDLDVFNIVAVFDFNMGAMENKGLNIFNDKYILASEQTATDTDYAHIEAIIAHEYFHNWTGNRITCRDWFQLCLKEGLTVFRDQEFTSDMRDRAVKRIEDVTRLWSAQFSEDAGPLSHPVRPLFYKEINNFYTATIYEKGAEIVRMLQTFLGKHVFDQGLAYYFKNYDGQATTIEHFLSCFEAVSSQDLSSFMRWYHQAGTPQLHIEQLYEEQTQSFTLNFTQTYPKSKSAHVKGERKAVPIPLTFGLFNQGGKETDLSAKQITYEGGKYCKDVFTLTKEVGSLKITGIDEKPIISILRDFSAPITIIDEASDQDKKTLACFDTNQFNRWRISQDLMMQKLLGEVKEYDEGKKIKLDPFVNEIFSYALKDEALSPALKAYMLRLPTLSAIALHKARDVNPDHIESVLSAYKCALATQYYDDLCMLYEENKTKDEYFPDAGQSGQRSLALQALGLAAHAQDNDKAFQLAQNLFDNATNMTECFGALSILTHNKTAQYKEALAIFEERYKDNPLVMDKWFALQAMNKDKDTIEAIKKLLHHKSFDIKNPNRVRAVYASFAMGNPVQFHHPSGRGYQFIADALLQIDRLNPQTAARIATAFKSIQIFTKEHQNHALEALIGLAKEKKLSKDLTDILTRILNVAK